MLILNNYSAISGYDINFINEVVIESSWDTLTDRATMIFPRNVIFKKDGEVVGNLARGNSVFNPGDVAVLSAGYSGGIKTNGQTERFNGYISKITPKLPIEVSMEDSMYLLKQKRIGKYSKSKITLSGLLSDFGISKFTADDRQLGYVRIADPNTTVAMMLDHLKRTQGIISYFRGDELISGFAYTTEKAKYPERRKNIILDSSVNIIDDSGLEYVKKGAYNISLKVVCIYPDNTKIEKEVGAPGGDNRTIYVYDIPEADLKRIAEEELQKFDYEGFRGKLVTFLEPQIKHGDTVTIKNDVITDKPGTYLVKSVTTTYGYGGGRQIVELDRAVNE